MIRLILGLVLLGGILSLFRIVSSKSRKCVLTNIKSVIPEVLLLVVTLVVFCPSSLFLANISEFAISYSKVLPVILTVAAMVVITCFIGAALIWNERLCRHYRALIGSVALGFYVQSNFLNPDMPELNGTEVNWSDFMLPGVVSIAVWLILIVGYQVFTAWKYGKFEKVSKYLSYFVSAVQLVTLVVLILTTPKSSASNVVLTKDDVFTVGETENVIVFVLDSMGGEYLEENINKHEELETSLSDFTFFRNAIAGGAYTAVGMPVLLTGIEFEPTYQGYEPYLQEAYADTTIYEDLASQGYDIRILTDGRYMANVSDEIIRNAYSIGDTFYISDYTAFAKDLYQFVGIYTMPQFLKPYFWMYTEEITSAITATNEEARRFSETDSLADGEVYKFDDVEFYQDMEKNGLEVTHEKAYRIYHIFGPHAPFTMNENIEYVGEDVATEEGQLLGSMKIVFSYINRMKELGVYDSSTIIITADHGRSGADGIQQNPALLIKQPGESHPLEYNDAPVHFRNVVATVARAALDDYSSYGPSVYDIDENSDVERLHTVAEPVKVQRYGEEENDQPFMRFIMPADATDEDRITPYKPQNINRIEYTVGDKIDFTTTTAYMDVLNYRIYKENSMGITSNEFSMHMDLKNYKGGDLEFKFRYSKVYNDEQRMKIYAEGELIADLTCKSESVGQDFAVTVPAERIKENELPIRIVFYNAVTPKQIGEGDDTRVLSVGFDYFELNEN